MEKKKRGDRTSSTRGGAASPGTEREREGAREGERKRAREGARPGKAFAGWYITYDTSGVVGGDKQIPGCLNYFAQGHFKLLKVLNTFKDQSD